MSRFRWIVVFALVVAAFFMAAQLFGSRTELEIQRGHIEVAWLKVEQDLDRRAATLPRLVTLLMDPRRQQTLAPLAAHQSTLSRALTTAAEARSVTALVEANAHLERSLQDFRDAAVAEPEVRRDADLQRLLEEILAIENRIHQDRTEYNEAVQRYNVRLALFPANLAANVFRLRRHELYLPTELRSTAEELRDATTLRP
ncbi:MAG: LemA family protein [Bryobacterales bacterium]|nr:LemA family protein [Bryobacterales bacterium]